MYDNDPIKSIQFRCENDTLEAFLNDGIHDFAKSIACYKTLCSQRISQEYSISTTDCYSFPQTKVNGRSDHPEVEYIELVINELADSDDWKVLKGKVFTAEELWTIREAWERNQFAIGISRLACLEDWVPIAKRVGSTFIFRRLDAEHFFRTAIVGDRSHVIWKITQDKDDKQCLISCPASFLESSTQRKGENIRLLITRLIDFGANPIFSDKCSYLQVHLSDTDIKVVFSLFSDLEMWTHINPNSTFSQYVQFFASEAEKRGFQTTPYFNEAGSALAAIDVFYDVFDDSPTSLRTLIEQAVTKVHIIHEQTELRLVNGPAWKDIHLTQEKPFRDGILKRLLEEMFDTCRLSHGNREFGKDFIISLNTKIGTLYGAVQAKAGDIDSGSGGKLDQVLNQLDDAFAIPFKDEETGEIRFISFFIIAASGKIREDAKEKLYWKVLKMGKIGAIRVWDRETIDHLIRKYFLKNGPAYDLDEWSLKLKIEMK